MADIQSGLIKSAKTRGSWSLVTVFTLSIFLSAALLFSVQPMFSKLALPLLGGAPNVWNTAMVFFQAMLLAGYLYAHYLSKFFQMRVQVLIHALVSSLGLLFIPLTIASGWEPPVGGAQSFWLIGLFAVSVGVPFFAISANSPLLQRWFSRTDDKDADDPYFLYAASNAGSLLSLCLYPVYFEPMMRLREQTQLWGYGYILMVAAILIAGGFAYTRLKDEVPEIAEETVAAEAVTWSTRSYWMFLAFIPSGLMLAVTTYMTTDVTSAPFLWIMPLALFLLTFIIVFAKKPIVTFAQLSKLFPWVVLVALLSAIGFKSGAVLPILISLAAYFIITLLCHSRLAETRPETTHLTEFYIWMSVGGVLGGIFSALVAPQIFNGAYEYFLLLFLTSFVVMEPGETRKDKFIQIGKFLAISAACYALLTVLQNAGMSIRMSVIISITIFFVTMRFVRKERKYLYSDMIMTFMIVLLLPSGLRGIVMKDRSFFGVLEVASFELEFGKVHMFSHGTTLHNLQMMEPGLRKVPLSYYSEGNTFDQALDAARRMNPNLSVSIVGLGAGAMACHEESGDDWTYFEIDPAVVDMALNPEYFTYMQDCSFESDVRIGDARLKIKDIAVGSQDIIMIDAFSSNVIPAHLVTKEALELYRSRLKDDGLIFFHTSNRLLDVTSVVVRLAMSEGLEARYTSYSKPEDAKYKEYINSSDAVVVGTQAAIDAAGLGSAWTAFSPSPDVGEWTDDYSHIWGTMIARRRGNGKAVMKEATPAP